MKTLQEWNQGMHHFATHTLWSLGNLHALFKELEVAQEKPNKAPKTVLCTSHLSQKKTLGSLPVDPLFGKTGVQHLMETIR